LGNVAQQLKIVKELAEAFESVTGKQGRRREGGWEGGREEGKGAVEIKKMLLALAALIVDFYPQIMFYLIN